MECISVETGAKRVDYFRDVRFFVPKLVDCWDPLDPTKRKDYGA